jgi:hypothetical protein
LYAVVVKKTLLQNDSLYLTLYTEYGLKKVCIPYTSIEIGDIGRLIIRGFDLKSSPLRMWFFDQHRIQAIYELISLLDTPDLFKFLYDFLDNVIHEEDWCVVFEKLKKLSGTF